MEKPLFSVQKGLPDDGVWEILLCGAGSLLLYTLFINFGYLNFMHAEIYNVYLYDPAGTQAEVSPLIYQVSSLEELDAALAKDTNYNGPKNLDQK